MMKRNKINKRIAYFSVLLTALSVFLTGCFNSVFYNIEKEVPLEKGFVSGPVNSVIRWTGSDGEYLVSHNGADVFYKKCGVERVDSENVWKKSTATGMPPLKFSYENAGTSGMSDAYNGYFITKIAADSSNLYAFASQVQVNSVGEVFVKQNKLFTTTSLDSEWKPITSVEDALAVGKSTVFCTNALNSSNRKAYLRGYNSETKVYEYYELSGASAVLNSAMASMTLADKENSAEQTIKSAIWFDSGVKFFSSLASIADEANNTYYYAKGSKIYSGTFTDEVYTAKYPIMSMAVTADSLIFGLGSPSASSVGTGGIYHLPIVHGQLSDKTTNFNSNAANTLTSSYQVLVLLVEDPAKSEEDANIFASANFKSSGASISVSYDNVGLWAYYPTRGNWNRE